MIDCCAEPVAGPLVDDRVLRHVWTALGPLARGGWPTRRSLAPEIRAHTLTVLEEELAGLYVAVDTEGRLRWLGKAHRDGGISARLRGHFRHPERARIFTGVFVVAADPFSPPKAIEAAEGRAADLLGLRRCLGARQWPRVTEAQWLAQVTTHPGPLIGCPRPAADATGDRPVAPA